MVTHILKINVDHSGGEDSDDVNHDTAINDDIEGVVRQWYW